MGIRSFIKSSITMLKLAKKPSREEFMLSLKIILLGIIVIGLIAFTIRFLIVALQSI